MTWGFLHPDVTQEHLGFLPWIIQYADPRPIAQQIDDRYRHGGGWRPRKGWTMDPKTKAISWPGDEPMMPIAVAMVGDETAYLYDHAWLAVVQKDGSFEVSRVD